jgi:hypothetical protein
MAKGKRKRRGESKGDGGYAGGAEFWAQLLRETLGNFAGQLMADGTEQMAKGRAAERAEDDDGQQDVAADVLRALSESGAKSIADLLAETGAGLTDLLGAVRMAREFRLVEVVGEDDLVVQLTPTGRRTASVLRREQIEQDGMKQLAS